MATEAASETTAPKKSKTLLIVILVAVLAIGGGGGGGAWYVLKQKNAKPGEKASVDKAAASKPVVGSETYAFENIVINPAGTGGSRFLSCSVAFQLVSKEASEAMKARDAEVRDNIVSYLSSKTVEQLDGADKRELLKAEILARVAPLFDKGAVTKVYFPQFVIQ